jgi:hypothetical protein
VACGAFGVPSVPALVFCSVEDAATVSSIKASTFPSSAGRDLRPFAASRGILSPPHHLATLSRSRANARTLHHR